MSGAKLKPWLILGLIFVAGIITGVALTLGMRSEWMRPPGAKQMQHHWMAYLNDRLSLTADQQTKIGAILSDAGDRVRDVHDDEVNRISAIFRETHAKIMPLLTADQQAKFAKLEAEGQRDFAHHMRHGWHGGPGGGPPPPGAPDEGAPPPGGPAGSPPPPPLEKANPGKDD